MDLDHLNEDLSALIQSDNCCKYTDLDDGRMSLVSTRNSINVLHINIRSLPRNRDSLTFLLNDLQCKGIIVHVISLCETFLTKQNYDLYNIENYTHYAKCRCDRTGGGTSLFVHDKVTYVRDISTPYNNDFESIYVQN